MSQHHVLTRERGIRPQLQRRHSAPVPGALRSMHCGHSPFYAHPQELVALLGRLGAEAGAGSSRAQTHGRAR
jgi:hypothetical protein